VALNLFQPFVLAGLAGKGSFFFKLCLSEPLQWHHFFVYCIWHGVVYEHAIYDWRWAARCVQNTHQKAVGDEALGEDQHNNNALFGIIKLFYG
jgi:hypothetical protein